MDLPGRGRFWRCEPCWEESCGDCGCALVVNKVHPLSTGAEKAFDKIQHLFLITTLQNVSLEGTYLNIRKAIYDTPRAAILLSSEKRKVFPWRADTRPGCLLSSLPFNLVLEVLARAVREEEEMQGIPVGKEGVGCPYLKMT